uniref:UDP-N-acetylmuramoyl-L-alanine--D-glutamate ligase n=1 Tax=Eubacterium cellulosolvens TaxID=29322 RepID=UPI0004886441|nr:UDP-N-acetylmuramoyl-L-alanine--D-glutamate ligase [[Eubacterium] cellulosolvens]
MDLANKKVLVFGSGKSGIGAAHLLLSRAAKPVIYDGNTKVDTKKILETIGENVEIILGDLPEEVMDTLDLVIMSPGVPCDLPVVEKMKEKKIPIWGEIELAYRIGKGKVLAVTGTNGKTTTVTLLGEIMKDYYPEVYVVGNIGTPYTDVVLDQTENAWTVAEVSSFQMETIEQFHPVASALTNITEDHLNRHHTMEEYIRCKARVTENQTEQDCCVLNYEDEVLRPFAEKVKAKVIFFSSRRVLEKGIYLDGDTIRLSDGETVIDVVKTGDLQLLGLHNFENVMVAVAMSYFAGVPMDSIRRTICAFRGVEHRIEFVVEKHGVRYYNDSKGTNPDAAIKGIQAMDRPTCLIGGGFDKELPFDDWINAFDGKVKFFALIGQTAKTIAETAERLGFPKERIAFCDNLEQAVKACAEQASEGDAVLLSPACASWGQFDNYEQRGDMFKEYVHNLG